MKLGHESPRPLPLYLPLRSSRLSYFANSDDDLAAVCAPRKYAPARSQPAARSTLCRQRLSRGNTPCPVRYDPDVRQCGQIVKGRDRCCAANAAASPLVGNKSVTIELGLSAEKEHTKVGGGRYASRGTRFVTNPHHGTRLQLSNHNTGNNPSLSDAGEPERVQGVRVSANAFNILSLRPALGRTFVAADDQNGAEPVVMISYGLWSRRYAKDQNIVGRSVNLNGEPRQIVGVLPSSFALPNLDTDIVVPLQPESDPRRNVRNSVNFLRMVGASNQV
jgi:hypothetical protein